MVPVEAVEEEVVAAKALPVDLAAVATRQERVQHRVTRAYDSWGCPGAIRETHGAPVCLSYCSRTSVYCLKIEKIYLDCRRFIFYERYYFVTDIKMKEYYLSDNQLSTVDMWLSGSRTVESFSSILFRKLF